VNELRDTIVRFSECVTNEMLISTCPETEYCLDVCRATMVPILSTTEHIRNFVSSSVGTYIDSPIRFMVEDLYCFTLLFFKAGHSVLKS